MKLLTLIFGGIFTLICTLTNIIQNYPTQI